MSRELSYARFNLYTLGSRHSLARVMAEELSYWADQDEKLIGFVFRDTTDNDYGWQILARDRVNRFRSVNVAASLRSEAYATIGLRLAIAETLRRENIRELGFQGDEPNTPTDVLRVPEGTNPEHLHPYFRELAERPGRAPARAVVREIGPWLAPADPHFVEEFQFHQFDQRLWELYLWASFRELGFDITQLEAPDFICRAPGIEFAVEATTVSPSQAGPLAAHPEPKTQAEMQEFLANYMPMKFGTPLTNKLNKIDKQGRHYWEREDTKDKPFVIAVADFHKQAERHQLGSMTYTQSALWPYLYGHRVDWEIVDGELRTSAVPNPTHKYGQKEIPSGFFDLPGSEHVSAVLFSNAGTISKFDRIGVTAGFGAPSHKYYRFGYRFNPDPNATIGIPFSVDVSDPNYEEGWSDELQIFHNPNARIPLSHDWLSGLTQFYFDASGNQFSLIPDHHVWSSGTMLVRITDDEEG
ncbi:MAG: hypothetical protein JJ959_02910 [Nisaea sp.]|uniref:hypothetical protein n=1 Tax=Nisaea sp. TaxID=2024842 RepID=UPI001B1098F3|nr:hypothetical protein [Nisaea sp.]MBO6559454.1 hypothetical protein [Nisaea sp.]